MRSSSADRKAEEREKEGRKKRFIGVSSGRRRGKRGGTFCFKKDLYFLRGKKGEGSLSGEKGSEPFFERTKHSHGIEGWEAGREEEDRLLRV